MSWSRVRWSHGVSPLRRVVPGHRPRGRVGRGLLGHHGRRRPSTSTSPPASRSTRTGHCHPQVVAAIQRPGGAVHPRPGQLLPPRPARAARRRGSPRSRPASIDTFFFANSGAEATEAAVKLAKQATGRPNVIVFHGSFHGRTHLTMAMTTSKTGYRAGHAPLPSGVFVAPFPDPLARRRATPRSTACLAGFDHLLASQTAPARPRRWSSSRCSARAATCPRPAAFLAGRRRALPRRTASCSSPTRCRPASAAPGRCSRSSTTASSPTSSCMAKGIASGFPISALGASAELDGQLADGHRTAAPTAATRSGARRRSPPSTC